MQLINTDGMALIGPGSEWFWTALTGLILAVTFFAIYRQLSIARSATGRRAADVVRDGAALGADDPAGARRGDRAPRGVDPAHLPRSSAGSDRRLLGTSRWPRPAWAPRCEAALGWEWRYLSDVVGRARANGSRDGEPSRVRPIGENFEWLAGVMARVRSTHGAAQLSDWASIMANLDTYDRRCSRQSAARRGVAQRSTRHRGTLASGGPRCGSGRVGTEAHATAG